MINLLLAQQNSMAWIMSALRTKTTMVWCHKTTAHRRQPGPKCFVQSLFMSTKPSLDQDEKESGSAATKSKNAYSTCYIHTTRLQSIMRCLAFGVTSFKSWFEPNIGVLPNGSTITSECKQVWRLPLTARRHLNVQERCLQYA